MQNTIFRCDVCGAEKEDINGWHSINVSGGRFTVGHWEDWQESIIDLEHVCGQECLHKRLSQWLEATARPTPEITQEEANG